MKNEVVILLVEDEVALSQTIKEILVLKGHQVQLASNGLEAISLLKKFTPDIIISDIMMPKMDGFELLKEIRQSATTELIPFLLLSAKVEVKDKLKGFEAGVEAYITKPFNSWELLSTIENIVNRRNEVKLKLLSRPQVTTTISNEEEFIRKLTMFLDNSISNKINIDETATFLNMSRSSFQKKIKKISAKSAGEFIKNYKLLKAKKLLDNRTGNVSEIARATGFDSLSYFSYCYKKLHGYPPSKQAK